MTMANPNAGMKAEAQKGLDWREEFGRGGTRVGAIRARQIVAGENLSDDTIKRMYSFFSRHEVDKEAEGFSSGEDGYPSNGRIAWALWGGDAGFSWSKRLVEQMKKEDERKLNRAEPDALKTGDFVSWNSAGGRARGKIIKIERDGKINIPNSDLTITGTAEDPAALIQVYRSGEPTDTEVGHKFSTLRKIDPIRNFESLDSNVKPLTINDEVKIMDIEKEDRHILNVSETDNSVIVEFKKVEEEMAEMEDIEESEEEAIVDEEERHIDGAIKYRTIDLSRASYIDEEKRMVRIGVSSEEPVERSFGMEVLGHSEGDINMEFISSGRAPLLLDHDMTKQIGVIEEFKLDESAKRTIALVRFGKSSLAREVFEDVKDGIRMNISVGYRVDKLERMDDKDESYYRASWTPMEVSSVSVPADQSRLVGVGRSENKQHILHKEVKKMENEKQEINLDEVKSKAVVEAKAEFKRNSKEILDLASQHNKRDLADEAISNGLSVEEFRGVLLENISNSEPLETPSEIGLTEKETKRFSILKAINAMANPTDRRAQEEAAFEFECSRAAGEIYGKTAQGVLLPPEVLANWSQRDLNASDDAGLIGQDFRGGDFIDVLRNSSAVMQNATILNGLSGDVKIPKKTAASTAAFISSEGGAAGESEMTIGSVTMSPKTLGAFTDVTRQLMLQSSLDVENLIRNDLAGSMAVAIDKAALEGSGSSGNPTGITNTTGINSVSLSSAAAPTFAEMVSMESAVAVDNALLGGLVYIVHPTNAGTLKTTTKDSGSGQFVLQNSEINGYPVVVSAQLTANNYVFGNMQDLLVGMFGGLDIVVDPYSNSTSGTVRVVALQSTDVNVRHAVSFCAAS
nr:phage major capsid protein [uncultured Mediterranean phage uvMED]